MNFDAAAVTVTSKEMEAVLPTAGQGPAVCGPWLGRRGATELRALIMQKLEEQPLSLARRATVVWKEVLKIAEQHLRCA